MNSLLRYVTTLSIYRWYVIYVQFVTMYQWLLAWSSSLEVVQLCLYSVACLAVQFSGGPPIFILDCLLVVVQVVGGPANAGNCVSESESEKVKVKSEVK